MVLAKADLLFSVFILQLKLEGIQAGGNSIENVLKISHKFLHLWKIKN